MLAHTGRFVNNTLALSQADNPNGNYVSTGSVNSTHTVPHTHSLQLFLIWSVANVPFAKIDRPLVPFVCKIMLEYWAKLLSGIVIGYILLLISVSVLV